MASKVAVVKVQIINVEPDPLHKGRTIVSARFDDGDTVRGTWVQGFSLLAKDRPISPEEFILDLKNQKIERPVDSFQYLREAAEAGKEYSLTISDVEPQQGS